MTEDLVAATPQEIAPGSDSELELSRAAGAGLDAEPVVPLVNLSQGLSKVVQEGEVPIGHYFNALTSGDYGDELEFVVVHKTQGRFYSDDDEGTFVAFGDIVPDNWPEKYRGRRFDELPDAEEVYSDRANAGEIEWDKGPPIQTTWNFIGYVPGEDQPVRLSFKSTAKRAARKIHSITDWAPTLWSNAVRLTVRKDKNKRDQDFFVPVATQGRATTPEERQRAIDLAHLIQSSLDRLQLVGDAPEPPAGPAKPQEAEDALEVS